jgi:hypothetical protein
MPANNALERTGGHRGPRLAAAQLSWPAAQQVRYASRTATKLIVSHARTARGSRRPKFERLAETQARHIVASAAGGVVVAHRVAAAEHLLIGQCASYAPLGAVGAKTSCLAQAPTHNKLLERAVNQRGRTVLAIDCALAGAQWRPVAGRSAHRYMALERDRAN